MTELIWIGNTLYPRWMILGALIAASATLLGLSAIMRSYLND